MECVDPPAAGSGDLTPTEGGCEHRKLACSPRGGGDGGWLHFLTSFCNRLSDSV